MVVAMTWTPQKFIAKTEVATAAGVRKAAKYAQRKMQNKLEGEGTGRIYSRPGGGTYQASSPGEPPAERTGALLRSLRRQRMGLLTYRVGTELDYGRYLEYGTERIEARPWLRSSIFENTRKLTALIAS